MGNIWSLLNLGVVSSSIAEGGESSIKQIIFTILELQKPTKLIYVLLLIVLLSRMIGEFPSPLKWDLSKFLGSWWKKYLPLHGCSIDLSQSIC